MDEGPLTVHQLRRCWRPFKDRVKDNQRYQPICIRFHRACSWLQRAEDLAETDVDQRLILRWIAFNSLYGRWSPGWREPEPDGVTFREFLGRLLKLDVEQRIATVLTEQRKLVMDIFGNDYLASYFWEEGRRGGPAQHKAPGWYIEKSFGMILDKLIERVYLLRCQLVHGAATCNGQLNRATLRSCDGILGYLLPAFMLTIVDHGTEENWGPLCYPPLGPKPRG